MADDTAKIIDFGVVHLAGSKSVTGQKGTFQYMSPEQAQLKEITPSSDIFALGVILYEALTLRKPFARNTVEETMQAVIRYIPPPVSEINPSVNQSISKVVHKCLAKQPIHRFLNARELAETLQKAYRNEPIFDPAKIQPRIDRAKAAFKTGDEAFASEILAEIEAEGNLDPQITVLRTQIEMTVKQKKIRQLLESARARMEQDEIPLALDKVREVLELDSENADALGMRAAMEKQRSESQIAKWLDLASTHLGNCDFGAARHAVEEVLAIRRADTRALDLLEKIESTEADAKRVRDQKEQLYSSALRAYQNGEIETALSKLERLLSVTLNNPQAGIPERDAVYQSFYKEVRSERDSIQSAMEEAQRQFSEKKFAGALTICRDLLIKYPNDGVLQALKIQIEDTERQEMSAYIATVSRSVESEPDLDRRANILREACERYPGETQFGQQLKMVRERRDLVNSIVAKARQYEERGQYSEAISQWDILRNIHPQYPGIAFELEQCKKKRSRQAREEEKTRAVEEIDGMMESRAFARAIEAAKAALMEFPGDVELAGLEKLAEEGLERTKESRRLFEEGQRALAEKDLERATELLRSGLRLDPRGPGLREAVVSVLTERARGLVEEDWRAAEPLYEEAKELDANHPAVRALRSSISEAKRQSFVGQCLTEARALLASGNSQAAFERVRAGRAEYPNDPRLEQYEAGLSKEVNELHRREERQRDRVALGEERGALERNPDRARMIAAIERSQVIRAKYPDDAEIEQTVADIEQAAKRVARVENLSEILRVETARTGTEGGPGPARRSPSRPGPIKKSGPELVDAKTKVFPQPQPKRTSAPLARKVAALLEVAERKVSEAMKQSGKWRGLALTGLGVIVAVGAITYAVVHFWPKGQTTPHNPQTHLTQVQIVPDPPDSTVSVDSKTVSGGMVSFDANGSATVSVSRLGYKPKQVPVKQGSDGHIALDPEPVLLTVETSDKSGAIEIDGQKIDLPDGSLEAHELIPDGQSHQLSIALKGGRPFTIYFQANPGQRPKVSSLDANDVFVIASLGAEATIYGGNQLKNVTLGDQKIAVTASGTELPALTDQNRTLKYGEGSESGGYEIETGNSPTLVVHSLGSEGQVTVTANVDNAKLTVDGREVKRGRNGNWQIHKPAGKAYTFVLSAEGYISQQWTMDFQRGQVLKEPRTLVSEKKEAVKSSLMIANNPAGTVVEVDNVKVGEIDGSGKGQFLNVLAPGLHTITLRSLCGDKQSQDFMASPPAPLQLTALKVTACGTISFQHAPTNAKVQIKRHDDSKWIEVDPSAKTQVRPGDYDVKADAPGAQTYATSIKIEPNREWQVPLVFVVQQTCQLQDAGQVVSEPGWYKLKNPADFVYLKAGCSNVNLIFTKPHPGILGKLGKKRPQWTIDLPFGRGRVQYELDDQKIYRLVAAGDENSDKYDKKVNAEASGQNTSLSVKVRIEGNRVKVTNDRGEVLDDYVAKDSLANAKLGIKTDAHFVFRSIP